MLLSEWAALQASNPTCMPSLERILSTAQTGKKAELPESMLNLHRLMQLQKTHLLVQSCKPSALQEIRRWRTTVEMVGVAIRTRTGVVT